MLAPIHSSEAKRVPSVKVTAFDASTRAPHEGLQERGIYQRLAVTGFNSWSFDLVRSLFSAMLNCIPQVLQPTVILVPS